MRFKGNTKKGPAWLIDIHRSASDRVYEVFHGSEADAREYEQILRGKLSRPRPTASRTIAELTPDYLEWVRNHSRSVSGKTEHDKRKMLYAHLLAHFGNLRPDAIPETWIEKYISKRKKEVGAKGTGNRAINLELLCLAALVKWATKNRLRINQLPYKASIPHILTREEIRRLFAAMLPQYRARALCLYNAGMRKDEVINLTWDRVDFEHGYLIVKGKGSKERVLPMSLALYASLWCLATVKRHTDYVFISRLTRDKLTDLRKPLLTAKKKAGIRKRVYPHLLRHCCGAHGLEANPDLRSMQEFLGHAQVTTTQIYTQIGMVGKRRIVEGLE